MYNHLENNIFDPSSNQIGLNKKASRLDITLCQKEIPQLPSVSNLPLNDMAKWNKSSGWTKSLEGIPKISADDVENYFASKSLNFASINKKRK